MTRSRPLARLLLATAFIAGSALGQDRSAICDRGDGVFYGQPFTLEQIFQVPRKDKLVEYFPQERTKAEAAATDPGDLPVPPSGDPLFPDSAGLPGGPGASCDGGGMVGAVECVAVEIGNSGSGSAEGSVTGGAPMGDGDLTIANDAFEAWILVPPAPTPDTAPALTADAVVPTADPATAAPAAPATGSAAADSATASGSPEAAAAPAAPQVVRQLITLRPVITPGAPGRVSFEPVGQGGIEAPPDLTEEEIADVSKMIADRNAALLGYRGELSVETQDGLIHGLPIPAPLPGLPEGVTLGHDPGVLAMGPECGSLFRAMLETDRLLKKRAEKVARIKRLKEMLKAERDKAGLLGKIWDSDEADRLERIIAYEEGNLKAIDKELAEHKATIDRRKDSLSQADHEREIAAIKADPERLKAEAERRRAALIEAARDKAKARWIMIEGEAAYARQIAAEDAMIKAARDRGQNELADQLEADKARLEAARDSWRTFAQSMIDARTREEFRIAQENGADGIGPATDAASLLLSEGKNPVEELEKGARDAARTSAERRAATDARTLGGVATETYGAMDFANDLYQSNQEIYNDPALFFRRYGAYAEGVGEAAYDNLKGIAEVGIEAADLAGEAFESGLSDVTGYEFNTYGHENLDALVAAGDALSKTDALQIGDLASKVAKAADRKISRMAASGEEGIREALSTTGYVAGSVLGVEQVAIEGAVKAASVVRKAAVGAELVADVAKVAEGVTDATKVAEGVSDAAKVADVAKVADAAKIAEGTSDAAKIAEGVSDATKATDAAKVAEGLADATKATDAAKVAEGTADAAKIADGATDASKVADAAKVAEDTADAAKVAEGTTDASKATDAAKVAEGTADAAKVAEGATDASKATDAAKVAEGATDASKASDGAKVSEGTADASKAADEGSDAAKAAEGATEPVEPAKTDGPTTPDSTEAPAEPAKDPNAVDRDAVTERDPAEAVTEPEKDPNAVDRDAATERDPAEVATEPAKEPDSVDPNAPTERDPAEAVTEPEKDPNAADRDAVTERDPAEVATEPAKEPDSVDPNAPTERDPAEAVTEPEKDPNAVDRDAAAERDPAEAPTEKQPGPDPAAENPADAPPPADTPDAAPKPPADEPVPTPDPNGSNQPRAPPETPREPLPIDPARIDTTLDPSPDYAFAEPVYNLDDLPAGGKFSGDPAPKSGVPGSNLSAPDGSTVTLGKKLGEGGTAKVFVNADDPSTIIKIVDASDDPAGVIIDGVGRKVAEKIQDATGNGNFRVSKVQQEFLVTGPNGTGKWSVKVEENMAMADGITDAAKRFKTRPPNPEEELTMALAIREMNDRGVVWTDHKPANFDIVPNPNAPTGYQMVIFDTGGIRPVTGATAESRAATAIEVQRTFDRTSKVKGVKMTDPSYLTFVDNYDASLAALDNRAFPKEVGVPFTPNTVMARPKGDRYLDFAMQSDAELLDYAKDLLGKEVKLPIAPP